MLNMITTIGSVTLMLVAAVGVGVFAARLARLLLPAGGERWLGLAATGTIWLWLVTAAGNFLLLGGWFAARSAGTICVFMDASRPDIYGWFTLPAAVIIAALISLIVFVTRRRQGWRLSAAAWPQSARTMLLLAAVLLLPVISRPLLVPMLGWDTITYHGVRAARLAQTGSWTFMPAPGGWGIFQMMPWGGELLTAWTMLFTGNDMFAAAADILPYLLLGAALMALAGELGLPPALAVVLVLYTLLLPAVRMAVGSGYVDIIAAAATALATLWAVRFARQRECGAAFLTLVALGLAAGTKASVLPLLVLLTALLAVLGWRHSGGKVTAVWLLTGMATWLLTLWPWIQQNLCVYNLPFGILPVTLGGVTLGRATPAMAWLLQLPEGASYVWQYERAALGLVFALPWSVSPHLGLWTVPLLLAGLAGLSALWHRGHAVTLVLALVVLTQAAGFYHPEFSMTRIISSGTAGRFLIAMTGILLVTAGFSGVPARWLAGYALAGMLWQYSTSLTFGWSAEEFSIMPVTMVFTGTALATVYSAWRRHGLRLTLLVAVLMVVLMTSYLIRYREKNRWDHVAASTVLHPVPRYWLPAAQLLDTPDHPNRIAVTSGPEQKADNWFMYYFLGSELQNRIGYIDPVVNDALCVLDYPVQMAEISYDSAAWQQRLRSEEATHVMCFRPAGRELAWMEARPDTFVRVAGDGSSWGCYQLR